MEANLDLVEHLSDLLSSGKTADVKALMSEESFGKLLEGRANDVIPIASYYLTKEIMDNDPSVFRYSGKVLKMCAEKGYPKECVMEFLAQIESLDDVKFECLLLPIQTVLLRIPEKKVPLMLCVFNVIYSYLNSLEVPPYHHLDSNSRLLMDCDERFYKIRNTYDLCVAFYEPLVAETINETGNDKRVQSIRLVLIQGLLQLLGNPLVSLDLEDCVKAPSSMRALASKIVNMILQLQSDPLKFLSLVEENRLLTTEQEKSVVSECLSNEIQFSDLSLSVFCYLIFTEKVCQISFPMVYEPHYVFKNCLTLALALLCLKETLVSRKGLLLVKEMLQKVKPGSVRFSQLSSDTHKHIIEQLSNIAIYHEVEENRKLSAELMKQHFLSFEPKAQFYILMQTGTRIQHPNVMGFLTTMLTSQIRETFSNNLLKEFFTGKRMLDLLKVFCTLNKGAEADLMENKDQIISALNLIFFLLRRDQENVTGVWNHITELSLKFLNPLREAIKLSRAHYELQIKTLDTSSAGGGPGFSLNICGQELGEMTKAEKRSVLSSSLTAFDLIEHLLIRAEECVEANPWLVAN